MLANRGRVGRAALLAVALSLLSSGVWACDTPVYQYTMQMWPVDAYRVFYFHGGSEDPADRAVNQQLAEAAQDPQGRANITFESVSVASLGSGLAAKAYQRNASRKPPFHVVVSPRGLDVVAERLTAVSAKALTTSPKREQLADLLCEGKTGVLVLLLGADEAENEAARAAGQAGLAEARQSGSDVGLLEVKRADATEKWFVRQMLAVEDDLKDLNHTMLFGVFGRGHILEPFVGRGISRGNVLDLIAFMGGPCSCEVKAAAPGTDLLVTCDWSRAVYADPASTPGLGYAEIPFEEPVEAPSDEASPAPVDPPATAKPSLPAAAAKAPQPATPAPKPPARTPADSPAAKPTPAASAALAKPTGQPADVARRGPNLHPPATTAGPVPSTPVGPGRPAQVSPAQGPALAVEPGRGPDLPTATPPTTGPQPTQPLSSRLGAPMGIAVGALAFGVILGGLALMWRRREQV